MVAVSKSQFRLMKAVEKGSLKVPGLSKKEAQEFTEKNKGKKRYSKLLEKVSNEKK